MHKEKIRWGFFRFSGRQLLGTLIFLLIAYPFFDDLTWGDFALGLIFSFVLISALLAVGGHRSTLILGLLFILPAFTFHWLPHFTSIGKQDTIPLASMALAIGFTAWQLLRFVLRAREVDTEMVCSGISIYILLGLLWAQLYLLEQNLVPDSFLFTNHAIARGPLNLYDAIYFSMATLTTANFGDIVPVSRYARALTSLEALCGVLYVAVLIARLMSLYAQTIQSSEDSNSDKK